MLLAGIIFIFNIILAYLSIDILKFNDSVEQIKIVMFMSIFIMSLTLFIMAFKQKKQIIKIHQKLFLIHNNFLNSQEKLSIDNALDLLKDKLENTMQNLTKMSHEKDKYLHLLEENLYQLGNMFDAMQCLDENCNKKIYTLILNTLNLQKEQVRLGLNQALEYRKSIKISMYDRVLQFQASVAIVNDDELETFLLAHLLSYFGIESTSFKDLSFDLNDFHLVFIKDKILSENTKKNYDFIVMGRDKNTYYEHFLTLPLKKKELEGILQNKLDKLCTLKFQTPYQNNVLLFKQNDFDTRLFFNIIEKQCDKNICINSFSQLKEELNQSYRLILLDYELIKLDLERMKNLLSLYKKEHPQSHIIFFAKENVRDFDFVSEILSDVSKNELVALLKKYLPQL
ncbi:hypothetical protein N4T57_02890 [Campylobacter hepaticus]|uniref:Uncharacterized protein n=1 Tax=Campylobacter hepaticus TaxID=1813019 RepID=A0A6A7JQY1_9BACT|nr:hypothetical protein [Campylobacter hepaticus]AXP08288.1 hypothetical protein A2J15_000785 [Campylobacter hepaticus]MCZ0772110.1 hypothetical protein [Campylobacter hepaticus]MCZ0773579.1 hypothetical protein [Campylobacter hepaticus]MCZ0774829.1 hypothetical protein [Campylobacter hepaticus]MDX2322709.1 hypothetical protein [Campylobacter hepaticus]